MTVDGNGLGFEVDGDGCLRIFLDGGEGLLQELFADGDGQQEIVEGVVLKNVCEEAADDDVKAGVLDGPCGVFAAGPAAEVLSGYQDFSLIGRVVENKIFFRCAVTVVAPVAEQVFAESVTAGGFEETGGDDLVGIDVLLVERNGSGIYFIDRLTHCLNCLDEFPDVCYFAGDGCDGCGQG